MSYSLIHPEELKKLAEKAEKSTRQLMTSFNKKKANQLDNLVHNLHNQIVSEIDCLQCANCCKSISPILYDKDIDRIAKALKVKSSEFINKYLKIDDDKDYVFQQTPCPFLDAENYCLIYKDRPKACREYPHTDRPRFYQILDLTLTNTYYCPISYYVMEKLKETKI